MVLSRNYGGALVLCRTYSRYVLSCRYKRNISTTSKCNSPASPVTIDVPLGLSKSGLRLSTGRLARLADGSAVAEIGETAVMVTAVSKQKGMSGAGFVPLTVDYRQKSAAAGRIPTNFMRRELGSSEKEILTSRMIDRSVRPLFPEGYRTETQLMCNLLSVDGTFDPDPVSINAASTALAVSDIPWNGPVGAVRAGLIDGEVVLNPTRKELSKSKLNLVVTASEKNKVVMMEAAAENLVEPDFKKTLKTAVKECQYIIEAIKKIQADYGKPKREFHKPNEVPGDLLEATRTLCAFKLKDILTDFSLDKMSRDHRITDLRNETIENLKQSFTEQDPSLLTESFHIVFKELFRHLIFETDIRCDGRGLMDLRPITCDIDLYRPLHGSALFQRGQTQVLCTLAFDSIESALKTDPVSIITGGLKEKNFMLHYEFPPYATNETGRQGAIGRREMGHGALAEKALRPLIPFDFPFTIRLTSEVLESNGSSSMASVCGGSLALMDAGVNISAPAAGVAIGLVTSSEGEYRLLTDILGIEDYVGDMDFKYAGTSKGMTALQMDVKLPGLPLNIVMEAVTRGGQGVSACLSIMNKTIQSPRHKKKRNWPVVEKLDVPAHKRSRFIGPGGINLKRLTANIGVQVTPADANQFSIFAPNEEALSEAKEIIEELLEAEREPILDFGSIYTAKVVEVRETGVMVTLYPNMQPAHIHNAQLDRRKVNHPSALGIETGQEIQVKYFGRDPVSGHMRLSRKVLQGGASLSVKDLT